MKKTDYISPKIEWIEVELENGIAVSVTKGWDGGDDDWYDEDGNIIP